VRPAPDTPGAPPDDRPDLTSPPTLIRAALHRKALADARQRAALARRLGVTDNEVLAIQHLARVGDLTPGQLSGLLGLSSGGTTGLLTRLEQAGHVSRHRHPRDQRSTVIRLSPHATAWATQAWAPYVAELDALATNLPDDTQEAIRRFLEHAAERHAERLARDADAPAHDALAVPLPGLWA
jgi:DNA-binding MarR family transcriptional regulator